MTHGVAEHAGDPVGVEPVGVEPPRPLIDALTAPFWEGCRQHQLMIQRCRDCGHRIHWPRPVCESCLSTDLRFEEVSGRATLYSYTVVNQAFHAYYLEKLPYLLATVELVEQPKLMFFTRLVDSTDKDLQIDQPLEVVFDDVAADLTLPLFAPVSGDRAGNRSRA